jgi:hypothetical protein
VFTAEHLLGFGRVDLGFQRVQCLDKIRRHVFPTLRPFEQHTDVVDLLGKAVAKFQILGEPALALQRLLRFGLVVPERGGGDFQFELGELTRVVGLVKDSSASRTRASAGPWNGGRDHQ